MEKDAPILAGERRRLREAVARARALRAGERVAPTVDRSIAGISDRLKRLATTESEAEEQASRIRALARDRWGEMADRNRSPRDLPKNLPENAQQERQRYMAAAPDKGQRYKMLGDELQQNDAARARREIRVRGDDGRGR